MTTLLLPCDGTANALLAVRHVAEAHRRGEVLTIHLLNVQPPFSAYVSRYASWQTRAAFHRERATAALAEARRLLDDKGITYRVHLVVGDKAACIADLARQLRCDRIVIGTARKSAFVRAVGNSLTNRLLDNAPVPVEVVGGEPASTLARVGIPAGAGVGMAWLLVGES